MLLFALSVCRASANTQSLDLLPPDVSGWGDAVGGIGVDNGHLGGKGTQVIQQILIDYDELINIFANKNNNSHLAEAEEHDKEQEEEAAPPVEDGGGLADGQISLLQQREKVVHVVVLEVFTNVVQPPATYPALSDGQSIPLLIGHLPAGLLPRSGGGDGTKTPFPRIARDFEYNKGGPGREGGGR